MIETLCLAGLFGYVGLYCAQQLLGSGFAVHGSVLSRAEEQGVLQEHVNDVLEWGVAGMPCTQDKE